MDTRRSGLSIPHPKTVLWVVLAVVIGALFGWACPADATHASLSRADTTTVDSLKTLLVKRGAVLNLDSSSTLTAPALRRAISDSARDAAGDSARAWRDSLRGDIHDSLNMYWLSDKARIDSIAAAKADSIAKVVASDTASVLWQNVVTRVDSVSVAKADSLDALVRTYADSAANAKSDSGNTAWFTDWLKAVIDSIAIAKADSICP